MPVGKTTEMWAICDRCEKILQYEPVMSGNVKTLVAEVRALGWTVKANGEAICPKCKQRKGDDHEQDRYNMNFATDIARTPSES